MNLRERAKLNEKDCQKGANYILYDMAAHNILAEPFRSYANGFPVAEEHKEQWYNAMIEIADTILMCNDEITSDGHII